MTDRKIEAGDLWAAVRGLGMYRMTRGELLTLAAEHASNPMFASRVIAEAARQVAATKGKE
jgi:hypothetical protein